MTTVLTTTGRVSPGAGNRCLTRGYVAAAVLLGDAPVPSVVEQLVTQAGVAGQPHRHG